MKKLAALIALSLLAAPAAYAVGDSCATAQPIVGGQSYTNDTTGETNWISNLGPAINTANDYAYTFTTGTTAPTGDIAVTAANYPFSLYLINACAGNPYPTPIGGTATVGGTISLSVTFASTQYWLIQTTTTAGGAVNGSLTFSTPIPTPVTLQDFQIN